MSDDTDVPVTPDPDFAQAIADQVESFLLALREIARSNDGGRAVSLLLLEMSQILLAGARLGAQQDFTPRSEYQPDVGPEADLDECGCDSPRCWVTSTPTAWSSTPTSPKWWRASSPTTSPASPATSRTACATTARATSARRSGGGSSPTSPPGATWPVPASTRCSPWSPTTGSTRTTRWSRIRSPWPRRCWTA